MAWKRFPHYWSFAWWRHQMETFYALLTPCAENQFPAQRPVTRSFGIFFICAWTNSWASNGDAGDLRLHRAHFDVIVMGRRITPERIAAMYSTDVSVFLSLNKLLNEQASWDAMTLMWRHCNRTPHLIWYISKVITYIVQASINWIQMQYPTWDYYISAQGPLSLSWLASYYQI